MIQRLAIPLFLFSVFCNSLFSQQARITVISGGNVSVVFNSIEKYQSGIPLLNYTTLGIRVDEEAADYKRWEVTIEVEDIAADGFNGSDPANLIPLDRVEVSTSTVGGCAQCNHFYTPAAKWKLSNAPEVIVDGDASGVRVDDITALLLYPYVVATDQFAISYYIGVPPNNTMMGYSGDFYSEVIIVTITMYDP
mgnify:CR=1 FL=1